MSEKSDEIISELGFGQYLPAKSKKAQKEDPKKSNGRDNFQTPSYAVDLLVPFIPKNVRWIWEPACGDGKIVQRLTEKGYGVYPSDIRKSDGWVNNHVHNFILDERPLSHYFAKHDEAIITNPPFSLKMKFYEKSLEYKVPFALLIPADYSGWIIKAIQDGAEKIIPTRRIDYITPSGLSGESGHTADFHSMWLTWGFNLGRTETFVELSTKDKKENI